MSTRRLIFIGTFLVLAVAMVSGSPSIADVPASAASDKQKRVRSSLADEDARTAENEPMPAANGEEEAPAGDGEKKPPEEKTEEEQLVATEFVLVQENLPYVPSSNTIVTKLPTSLMLTPFNVGVVGEPLMEEQDALELSQALTNISGFNVQTQSGIQDFFYVRGFDSLSGGLILTDGAREPEASYYQMYNVQRVELLKGPGGFLYGGNPLSGAVNVVRKQPVPEPLLNLTGMGGSFGTYEATLDYNQPTSSGDFRFRLGGLWRESDGYRDDKNRRTWGLSPSFAWQLGSDSTLNLDLEFANLERSPDGGLPLLVPFNEIPDVPRTRSYQSPYDFSEQQVSRMQLNWESSLNETVRLRNKLYARQLDWRTDGTVMAGAFPSQFFDPNAPPGSFTVVRNLTALDDLQRFLGNQFEAVWDLESGPVEHQLLTGLELEYLTDDFELGIAPSCSS
jgi:outer membrane receptor for monomeric catechols